MRIFLSLFLLLSSSLLSVNAQLTNRIWGIDLGTYISDARQHLRNSGYGSYMTENEYIPGTSTIVISGTSLRFGGYTWQEAHFEFKNGYLKSISFSAGSKQSLLSTAKKLNTSLMNKYEKFNVNFNEKDFNILGTNYKFIFQNAFCDGKNYISVSLIKKDRTSSYDPNVYYLDIRYGLGNLGIGGSSDNDEL